MAADLLYPGAVAARKTVSRMGRRPGPSLRSTATSSTSPRSSTPASRRPVPPPARRS
ncbi:hypothetical protein ACFQ0M_01000 [Kitasatospora aburaviensis]